MEGIGELQVTRTVPCPGCEDHPFCGTLRIVRADPRILVSRELIRRWLCFGSGPAVDLREGPGSETWTLRPQDDDPSDLQALGAWIETISHEMQGWTITVRAENRIVVYRLSEYLSDQHCYVAEWPD